MKSPLFATVALFVILFSMAISTIAQPRGGRGRGPGGFDPDEMVKREKQNLYKSLDDLSDDQKLLLDGIYDEFALSIREIRDELRQTRDFQAMRPKMLALREEKNGLIKDVLNEEQYEVYLGMMENRRRQMEEYRRRRLNEGDRPDPPPAEETPSEDESG
jgi:hypothetical protein